MADIFHYILGNQIFLLGMIGIIPMIILLRYYIVYGSVDFLVGSGIFFGLLLSVLPYTGVIPFLINLFDLLRPTIIPAMLIYGGQILAMWCFSHNAISTSLSPSSPEKDRILLRISTVSAVLLTALIVLWTIQHKGYFSYRWVHIYGTFVGLLMIYYYSKLDIVISSMRAERVMKVFVVTVGISRFFHSLFEVLWSISRGQVGPFDYGITEQAWGIYPIIHFISYEITPIPGKWLTILGLLLILKYPQFFIVTQTQILRAKKLYRGMSPAEDDSQSIARTRISSYLESIPEDFLEANNIQLLKPKS